MSIKEMPKIITVSGGKIWTHSFEKFKATVYVPENEMMDDVLNYGFIAPYLLVFAEQDFSIKFDGAVDFLFDVQNIVLSFLGKIFEFADSRDVTVPTLEEFNLGLG